MIAPIDGHNDVFEITSVIFPKLFREWVGNTPPCLNLSVIGYILNNLGNAIIVFKILVEGKFIMHPQPNQNGHSHTDRQSGYINKRMHLAFSKIAPGGFEIVFKHDYY